MKMNQVDIGEDLAVAIGDRSVRVSPGEAFRLAEKLIRTATTRMIVEETEAAVGGKNAPDER